MKHAAVVLVSVAAALLLGCADGEPAGVDGPVGDSFLTGPESGGLPPELVGALLGSDDGWKVVAEDPDWRLQMTPDCGSTDIRDVDRCREAVGLAGQATAGAEVELAPRPGPGDQTPAPLETLFTSVTQAVALFPNADIARAMLDAMADLYEDAAAVRDDLSEGRPIPGLGDRGWEWQWDLDPGMASDADADARWTFVMFVRGPVVVSLLRLQASDDGLPLVVELGAVVDDRLRDIQG